MHKISTYNRRREEQSRIHGNLVADGWAEAVMQKLLSIQQGQHL